MKNILLVALVVCGCLTSTWAQCKLGYDQIDEFDSTRMVSSLPVSCGYMIPSKFETAEGPKLIDEAKLLFSYAEHDSINSFFLTIAIQEYNYESIDPGFNVLFKLSDSTEILALYNTPDVGEFDKTTNMRLYQHTVIIPLDFFNRLTFCYIEKIRIEYKKRKRTLTLSKEQQKELQKAIHCVGKAVDLFPVKP